MGRMIARDIRILPWSQLDAAAKRLAAPDAVFFEASRTQAFASDDARAAFREFWLGQYLAMHPDLAFVARDDAGRCVGYAVAWPDDPNTTTRFDALSYLRAAVDLTARYPAHMHVNVGARSRGRRLGTHLVSQVCAALRRAEVAGVHVVTEVGARNIGFYEANGFSARASLVWDDRRLAFLARDLWP